MNAFIPLVERFVADQIIGKEVSMPSKNRVGLGVAALSGLFFTIGMCFLIYSAYLWLSAQYTADVAMMGTGVACFIAAFVIIGGLYGAVAYKRYRVKKVKNEITDMALLALDILEEEITTPVQENPKTSVLLASAAGLLTGSRIF